MSYVEIDRYSNLRIVSGSVELNLQLVSTPNFNFSIASSGEKVVIMLTNLGLLTICGDDLTLTDNNHSIHLTCENDLVDEFTKEFFK